MTTSSSIARTFARRLGHNLLVLLALGTVLMYGVATQEKAHMSPKVITAAPATVMEAKGADCWASPADHPADLAGQNPASVVVSGGESTEAKVIKRAVEQAYFGVDHGLTVYGFCR